LYATGAAAGLLLKDAVEKKQKQIGLKKQKAEHIHVPLCGS
jgi:hypothetical protein